MRIKTVIEHRGVIQYPTEDVHPVFTVEHDALFLRTVSFRGRTDFTGSVAFGPETSINAVASPFTTYLITSSFSVSGAVNNNVYFISASTVVTGTLFPNQDGVSFFVKKIEGSSNEVVLRGSGSVLIDRESDQVIDTENTALKLLSYSNNWWII